jgi:hypothetical protein
MLIRVNSNNGTSHDDLCYADLNSTGILNFVPCLFYRHAVRELIIAERILDTINIYGTPLSYEKDLNKEITDAVKDKFTVSGGVYTPSASLEETDLLNVTAGNPDLKRIKEQEWLVHYSRKFG